MTEPPSPGWYADPRGDGSPTAATKPPISKGVRIARTVGLLLVLWAVLRLVDIGGTALLESITGPLSRLAEVNVRELFIVAPLFGLMGWTATKVSYRWFDFLLFFIPFYNVVLLGRLAWRLSYLPYRDWAPRPEEVATWRQVDHPTEPGALLYVVAA